MYYLTNYETNFQPRFKKEFVSVSVEFILKNNINFRGRTLFTNPRKSNEYYCYKHSLYQECKANLSQL